MERIILLASHGQLADGMASALKFIIGEHENIKTLCAYLEPDFNLEEEVKKVFEKKKSEQAELVVFTDVYGGSVNNEFMKFLSVPNFYLISNMNFASIVQIATFSEELNDETVNEMLEEANIRPLYCNKVWKQTYADDDDL